MTWTTRFGGTPIADVHTFLPAGAPDYAIPYFSIAGEQYVVGPYTYHRMAAWNVVDTVHWQKAKHYLSFGTDLRLTMPKYIDNGYLYEISFSASSILLNQASSGALIYELPTPAKVKAFSFFANDEWHLNQRLTLNYGLRWEINPAPTLDGGLSIPTYINFPNAATFAIAPAGTPFYPTFLREFAPRVGASYQLNHSSSRATVLRGGWGLYYDLGTGVDLATTHAYPFEDYQFVGQQAFPYAPGTFTPVTLPAPLTSPLPAIGYKGVENLVGLPRTQQYSLSLEQQLGKSQVLSLSFVGNHGQKQLSRYQYLYKFATPTLANGNSFVITRNDGVAGGFSWYDGLQLNYRRDLSKGLQVLANYTFSHALDAGSTDGNFGQSRIPNDMLSEDARLNYGSSDYDHRHIFNFAIVYDVPKLHSDGLAARVAEGIFTNGWVLSPNFKYQSGSPFSMTVTYDDNAGNTGINKLRLDRVPGQPLMEPNPSNRGGTSFNPAAFAIPASALQTNPALATNGDTGRNSFTGPALAQLDFALRRDFHLYEHLSLQFSAEFFNLFNHPNFQSPDGSYGYVFNKATQGLPACGAAGSGVYCDYNFLTGPGPYQKINNQGTYGELNTLGNGVMSGAGPGSSFDISLNPRYSLGGPRSSQFSLRLSF